MKKVAVLMSTYNGEKFLEEQLVSILNQKNVDIDIFVRDDGSEDSTVNILKRYKEYNQIKIIMGKNIGPAKSFLELLFIVKDGYDYYAFSDQDDIWEENKIIEAIKKMEEYPFDFPCVYASKQKLFINNVVYEPDKITRKIDFYSSMIRNVIVGCTMVFNKKMYNIITEYKPEYIRMHDIWLYRVAESIGANIVYDDDSYILYRQHENNVEGAKISILSKIFYRKKMLKKYKNETSKTASEILIGFFDYIENEKIEILECLRDYRKNIHKKIFLLFNKNIKTEKKITTFLFKLDLLLNRI